jgi:hypothetical protein
MAVDNYERTQLWKEYTHPIIIRQSAVKAAQEFASMNELQLSLKELLALSKKFEEYFNTGDTTWVAAVEKYFKTKIKI